LKEKRPRVGIARGDLTILGEATKGPDRAEKGRPA